MKNLLTAIFVTTLACASCHPSRSTTGGSSTTQSHQGITEKYWKLITLDGVAIPPTEEGQREAHFILKKEERRVTGSGGCNLINGTYELPDRNGIRFVNMLSTKMACSGPSMATETKFLTAMNEATDYVLIGDTLTLYAGKKSLAVLNAVYLR